jgi:hypothetical protein
MNTKTDTEINTVKTATNPLSQQFGIRFVVFAGMVLMAALSRLLPHPPNFAPINALALFAGAYIADKRLAFVVPVVAMLLSDSALELTTGWGFYDGMWVVYVAFCLVTLLGFSLRRSVETGDAAAKRTTSAVPIAGATLAASLLFFLVTNFMVWAMGTMYPHTAHGLVACFAAALPFFGNSLLGDAAYAGLLFGGFALAERVVPALQPSRA